MVRWGLVCLLLGSVLWFGLAQESKPTPSEQETTQETTSTSPEGRPGENQETEEPPLVDPDSDEDPGEVAPDAESSPENPPSEEQEEPEAPSEDAEDEGAREAAPETPLENEEETPEPAVERSIPEGAEPLSRLTLKRENRNITVNHYAPKAEGGEFVLNAPNCDEEAEEKVRTTTVYGADAYWVETLVNDTRITSAIALMRKPDDKEIKEEEVLELFGGSLEVSNETKCPENIQLTEQQDVRLIQGRTTVDGLRFDYDNKTGIGKMKGPVKLDRIAEGESPALSADAKELEYNEETDETKLFGNVTIESDGRVSKAESVDFDDANSIAILRGSPARSEKDGDVFEGNVITYFLDSNDVRVEGNIEGSLEVDLGNDNPTTTTSGTEESQDDFGTGDDANPNDPFREEDEFDEFDSDR